MRFLLAIVLLFVAGCSDIRVTTLLAMDFTEEENASFMTFRQDGEPGSLAAFNSFLDRPASVSIRNGQLFIADAPTVPATRVVFSHLGSPRDSLTYVWRGELSEVGATGATGSGVVVDLKIPQPPRGPYTALSIRLESREGRNTREVGVYVLDADGERQDVGTLFVGAPHSVLIIIDLESQTFRLAGGNSGGITSTEFPLLGTVRTSRSTLLEMTTFRRDATAAEYKLESIRILSTGSRS